MMRTASPPLNVIHTESSLGWGGQEIRILTEAAGMIARGHQVTLLTPGEAPIFEEAKLYGVPTQALPIAWRRPAGLRALRDWIRRNPVDLFNTHSSTDSWLVAVANASLRHAPPQVRTRHISAPISTGWSSRWLYTRATRHVVTTGEALRRTLIDTNGYPAERITSIPTGIDLRKFDPAHTESSIRRELGIDPQAPVITIVATQRSWKGHTYLFDAFAALKPRWPELQLLVVGDGPQWANLQAKIQADGLQDLHMAGLRRDIPQILAGSDIFALPSYANEGVPQSILQAMAMQLPIVSTPVGAIEEAVLDGKNGLLVQPHSAEAVADALHTLLGDPARRKAMGQEGRRIMQQEFSLERMLERMEAVFLAARERN